MVSQDQDEIARHRPTNHNTRHSARQSYSPITTVIQTITANQSHLPVNYHINKQMLILLKNTDSPTVIL